MLLWTSIHFFLSQNKKKNIIANISVPRCLHKSMRFVWMLICHCCLKNEFNRKSCTILLFNHYCLPVYLFDFIKRALLLYISCVEFYTWIQLFFFSTGCKYLYTHDFKTNNITHHQQLIDENMNGEHTKSTIVLNSLSHWLCICLLIAFALLWCKSIVNDSP